MSSWKLITTALMAYSLVMTTACENAEEDAQAIEQPIKKLATFPNLSNSLLPQIDLAFNIQKSNSIKFPFCIHTVDIHRDAKVEDDVQEWCTIAMNTWIEPLIGENEWNVTKAEAYRVEPDGTTCPKTHNGLKVYEIKIKDMEGGNNSPGGLFMQMGDWGIDKTTVLHEMGHGIGLADTYGVNGTNPLDQKDSIMKNAWSHDGELQQDDIDGVRFIWARIRGDQNACPDGYKQGQTIIKGEVKDQGPWNETYCVIDDDTKCEDTWTICDSFVTAKGCKVYPDDILAACCASCKKLLDIDNCPDDPKKVAPGECGCGVPEGTCDDNTEIDNCPDDPDKTEPGECGCGVPEGTCDDNQSINGLLGEYFDSKEFTSFAFERVDETVDFSWGRGSPSDQIDEDTFSVRWTGFIQPKYSEEYTFYTISDDGIKLWIDDELIIDNWTAHPPTEDAGTIDLQAGRRYSIKIEYFEQGGGATVKLLWSSNSQSKQTVPNSQLFVAASGSSWQ